MCDKYLQEKKGTVNIMPSSEYHLKSGEDFVIELKENHFSSFRWHLVSYNKDLISIMTKNTFDMYPDNIIGKKKIVLWRFKSFYRGKITLKFNLYRPWEGINSSVDEIIYTIYIS